MSLNSPGDFLGTKPIGEQQSLGSGLSLKGPATFPALISLAIFSRTASGFLNADGRQGESLAILGPW